MLALKPVSLREENEYVRQNHRHHKPVVGHKFSIGCESNGVLVGVVIAGRPVSRYLDDGRTLEVTRCCTNGERNACSMLYGAAARAAAERAAAERAAATVWKLSNRELEIVKTLK